MLIQVSIFNFAIYVHYESETIKAIFLNFPAFESVGSNWIYFPQRIAHIK